MAGELVLTTLGCAWGALRDRGIDACVMGGLALAHWDMPGSPKTLIC
jgi:hypothetical protein